MTTKIGLIGDVHAYPEPLEAALVLLEKAGVEMILCTGDIAGYGNDLDRCVELLIEHECKTVIGNHDRWHLQDICQADRTEAESWIAELPSSLEFTIAGKSLYLVHSRPPEHDRHGIKLLDKDGELVDEQKQVWTQTLQEFTYDVLIVGHSHQVYAEQLGTILVINPGTPCFNHVCGILTLPDMKVEFLSVSNKIPVKAWNWGLEVAMLDKQ